VQITANTVFRRLSPEFARGLATRYRSGEAVDPISLSRELNNFPAIRPGDLKRGDAVLVITTGRSSALLVLAGAEPLLSELPATIREILSAWTPGDWK